MRAPTSLSTALVLLALACESEVPSDTKAASPNAERAELSYESVPESLRQQVGETELARMKSYLESRYHPADVMATRMRGNDIIDCVDELKQPNVPAGQGPLPKGPATKPVYLPGTPKPEALPIPEAVDCPEGSVPMRRISLSEVARVGTLERYIDKP